jgi:hypothetical protein
MRKTSKKGVEAQVLFWMIVAVIILVIVLGGYFFLRGKGLGALDFIKNAFRFRS